MRKLLFGFLFTCILIGVKTGITEAQTVAGNPNYVQVAVGATPVTILAFDNTRIDWLIHTRNGAINCISGFTNGQPSLQIPTSSFGFEITSGLYLNNMVTESPITSISCVSESGTVTVDIKYDSKN